MCLIIWRTPFTQVSSYDLFDAYCQNDDGIGVMWSMNGELKIRKFMDYDQFEEFYMELEAVHDEDILIHFRWATHGLKNLPNVHPFTINENLGMMHNGIIASMPKHNTKSDTALLAEELYRRWGDRTKIGKKARKKLTSIAGFSKLAFMDNTGDVTLINEHLGTWEGGIWYSNLNWKYKYCGYRATKTYASEDFVDDYFLYTDCDVEPVKKQGSYYKDDGPYYIDDDSGAIVNQSWPDGQPQLITNGLDEWGEDGLDEE